VKGSFWVTLTIVSLGILLPIGFAIFAWFQRMKSESWETTILKRPPIRLLLIPVFIPFLMASLFWIFRQSNCGIVQFDVDDPDFTVHLGNLATKWNAAYSADFYALRLRSGQYFWEVKHGATVINRGEIDLAPRSRHTITTRSPYPLGQAAVMSLPGRWKLQGWQPYGNPISIHHQPHSVADYIDVTKDTLHIQSALVMDAWSTMLRHRSDDTQTDLNPQSATFSFEFPTEPPKHRGPKWIDLYAKEGPTHVNRLFARGVFMADEKFFVIRLVPAKMQRPMNWNPTPNDKSISFTFQRANDLTLMQGKWKVIASNIKGERTHEADGLELDVIVNNDKLQFLNFGQINGKPIPSADQPFTITLNETITPKRITLTGPLENGVISVIEGVYKVNGGKMMLLMGMDGRIPQDSDDEAKLSSIKIELDREVP
jgi:uncharacterized protein (TIGR03067 family)